MIEKEGERTEEREVQETDSRRENRNSKDGGRKTRQKKI